MKRIEHIIGSAEPMRLTAEEKSLMRGRLSMYADMHPYIARPVPSPYAEGWTETFMVLVRRNAAAFALVALLAGGGAVSAAANSALPGDALYSVKVKFNEQVTGLAALSSEAKATHETKLAEKRLQEAASLSVQGRLTPAARDQIEQNLVSHVQKVEAKVQEMAKSDVEGAVEKNSDLETTLRAHERVLSDLSSRSLEAGSVATAVRRELTNVSQTLSGLEREFSYDQVSNATIRAQSKASEKSVQAEDEIAAAKDMLESLSRTLKKNVLAEAQSNIDDAYNYLSLGYSSTKSGYYNNAFVHFQASIRFSRETKLLLKAATEFGIAGEEPKVTATTTPAVATTTPTSTSTPTSTPPTATTTDLMDVVGASTSLRMEASGSTTPNIFKGTTSLKIKEVIKEDIRSALNKIGL